MGEVIKVGVADLNICTVSYTHLDVYKRQNECSHRACKGL